MGEDAQNHFAAPVNDQEILRVPPPANLEEMILELVKDGPIIQSQLPMKWKRAYPNTPLSYQVPARRVTSQIRSVNANVLL
jgi:hypothetical protein